MVSVAPRNADVYIGDGVKTSNKRGGKRSTRIAQSHLAQL